MTTAPDKFFDVRITSRVDFADDLWMIRVVPAHDFHFAPGQYATLGVDNGSGLVERAYSIASSPYESEIEFFFELVPQGALTPLLYRLGPGDTIKARKVAKGRFTLDTATGHTNHLLLSTVTGVAPFVSYVRTLRKDWLEGKFEGEHKLFMVQGASHSRELGYRAELEQLSLELPWLTYIPTISRPWDEPAWAGETGRVDDVIRKYTDLWALDNESTTAYLCGHPDMIENGKGILRRRGWKKEAMREEVYFIIKHAHAE
jgi:ferredoxin--NADP+ reductase